MLQDKDLQVQKPAKKHFVTKGHVKIIFAAASWGMLPVISRYLYIQGVQPLEAAAMRAYVAAAVLTAIVLFNKSLGTFKAKDAPFYMVNGLLSVTGTYAFYLLAISRLSSAMAVMLLYTAPAFVVVMLRLIYKTPITKSKLVALVCTFAGCFFVVKAYDASFVAASLAGIIFGLFSGMCYAMLTVFGTKGLKMYPPLLNVAMQTIFGALAFLVIKPPWHITFTPYTIVGFCCIGVFGSVIPYSLYLSGMKDGVDGSAASILAYIEPVFATAAGIIIFNDVLELPQMLGIGLVLFGAFYPAYADRNALSSTDNI